MDNILSLCVINQEKVATLQVLEMMESFGYKRDESSYRACLQRCYDCGNGEVAEQVILEMEKEQVHINPYDIGMVIGAICKTRKQYWDGQPWERPLEYLKSKASTSVLTDGKTIPIQAYNILLELMTEQKEWQESLRLVKTMENSVGDAIHPTPQLSTYRIAGNCCVKAGPAPEVVSLLYSMRDNGVKVNVFLCF